MSDEAIHPAEELRDIGRQTEGPFDMARAALLLSALDHPGRDLDPYWVHLKDIADAARREARLVRHPEDGARALSALLVGRFGYDGDRLTYDDPRNADLMSVIDRRRGLPVALGILYIHAARAAGFEAAGLNTPGHFLLRIDMRGSHALIDPFNGGAALDRERLGAPPAMSASSPDDPRIAEPVPDVDVLLRLENNLKLRALGAGRSLTRTRNRQADGAVRTSKSGFVDRSRQTERSCGRLRRSWPCLRILPCFGSARRGIT